MKERVLACLLAAALLISVTACGKQSTNNPDITENPTADNPEEIVTNLSKIDTTKWQYNADDNVYYQIGIAYCENPADTTYETLAVFVPGSYMDASENNNGTYTCSVNTSAKVGSYTAETAPIVMPINTPGYSAMAALTAYSSVKEYTRIFLHTDKHLT